jgi:hypothetical protein
MSAPEKCMGKSQDRESPASVLKKTSRVPFWAENPNVLFQQEYILEFFPVDSMTFEQKLNAVSRTVIVLTVVSFIYTRSIRLLAISAISLFCIFLMFYYYNTKDGKKQVRFSEGFESSVPPDPVVAYFEEQGIKVQPDKVFDTVVPGNPLSNVLLPDYDYNPNKKPAPPSYNENINKEILNNAKQMVIRSNPGQPDIADKLFNDLGDEFVFEQSMQPFYSNASTTIPNDQGAFADFCYGSMISCKEGNMFACARNMTHYQNN